MLYTGIQYSPDLSELGHWKKDLVVFLDTEHLFNATGLNGPLYKKVFDDFKSLTSEINLKKGNGGKITLRYFQETNDEVDKFFYAAEKIVEKHKLIDPSKTAMIAIVDGCNSKSDVLAKKAKFLDAIKKLKITIEESMDYYMDQKLNIESEESIARLRVRYDYHLETDMYHEILKKFTKINVIRGGNNNVSIDSVAAIFMTEKGLTQNIAFLDIAHDGTRAIPFATNIEFLTERIWFKLNKGFGQSGSTPASFDVVVRAKLVLSSQINHAVSDTYRELLDNHKNGKVSSEEVALLVSELRGKASTPDDISIDVVDDSVEFMSSNFIEKSLREKSLLEKKSADGVVAINELKQLKYKKRIERLRPMKRVARRQYCFLKVFFYGIIPIVVLGSIFNAHSQSDTTLSVIFGSIGLVCFLVTIKLKLINQFFWRLSKKWYRQRVAQMK